MRQAGVVWAILIGVAGWTAQVKSGDGLALTIAPDGAVRAVIVNGRPWPVADVPSGLLLRDVAAEGQFVPAGGAVAEEGGAVVQRGTSRALGLEFEVSWRGRESAVRVDGFIRDTTGTDRAITVRLALPIEAAGGTWWQDILGGERIGDGLHHNVRSVGLGATGSASTYTWSAITTEVGELCLGIPLDHFVVHRLEYDGSAHLFYVDFDFGLAEETQKFVRRADFHAVVYHADPRWGFRSATEKYYRIFPQSFVRRTEREGLWMPFTSPSKVEMHEDFNFVFHEGSNEMGWDDAHDILSFPYVSPHWAMLWLPDVKDRPTPRFVLQRLEEMIANPDMRYHDMALLVKSSAIMNAEGGYHFTIGRAHWAPSDHGPVGWFANFPANSDPELEQLGLGPTTGGNAWRTVQSVIEDNHRRGIFVDGIYFDGVDERPPDNYNRLHWRYADFPLTFGTDTRRPCQCGPFASYDLVRQVADYLHATGRLTMANGVPAQFPFVYHDLDLAGRELEPSIDADPVSIGLLAMARSFSHHKPCVYLYKPRLEERFDRDLSPYLIDYVNRCLLYAAEPSLFKIFSLTNDSFYYSFFERPDWYNAYRPIFIEYLPLVRALGLAGWEPVTQARVSDDRVLLERFGTGERCFLVAYNPQRNQSIRTDIEIDLAGLGCDQARCVADLVQCARLSLQRDGTTGRLELLLPPRRAAVLALRASVSGLAAVDLEEAVRYVDIARGRLRNRLEQRLPIDFEQDPDGDGVPAGWSIYTHPPGSAQYASDAQAFHSAPRATRITLRGDARGTQSVLVPARPGRTYRMSVWVKADMPAGGNAHIYAQWVDQAGNTLGNSSTSPAVSASTDWVQLTHEITTPAEKVAGVRFVLVATKRGEGDATVWFDDPRLVEAGDGGAETVLLPLARELPPAGAQQTTEWLQATHEHLAQLLSSVRQGSDAEGLARSALTAAADIGGRAQTLAGESDSYAGTAAALRVGVMRLERAARLLVGWGMTVTGRSEVAQGEEAEFMIALRDAGAAVSDLNFKVVAPEGWQHQFVGPTPRSLAPGETATATIRLSGGSEGGEVEVISSGRIEGGRELRMSARTAFEVVPALQAELVQQGPPGDGEGQRLALITRNARAQLPVSVTVRVAPPPGFAAQWSEKSLLLPPSEGATTPIVLTADAGLPAAWREAAVSVLWQGGALDFRQPFVYAPASANLLRNPGFEESAADSAPPWGRYGEGGYVMDGAIRHWGERAIRVESRGERGAGGAVQRVFLNQTEPRPLVVRGWSLYQRAGGDSEELKTIGQTEHAGAGAGERTGDYSVYVDLHYVGGGALYGQAATFDKSVSGWQFSEYVIHVSRPVADATVYLLLRNQPGTAWFDDTFVGELGTNLAVLPGAEAGGDSHYDGYSPAPLNDGSIATAGQHWSAVAWASAERAGEHWAQITLPQPLPVSTVVIYWATDGGLQTSRAYRVQVEVAGGWRDVATVSDQAPRELSVHCFDAVTTRQVRILLHEGGGPASRPQIMWIREIEVY